MTCNATGTSELNAAPKRILAYLVGGSSATLAVDGLVETAGLEFGDRTGAVLASYESETVAGAALWALDADEVDRLLAAGVESVRVVLDGQILYAGPVVQLSGWSGEARAYQVVTRYVAAPRGEDGRGIESISDEDGDGVATITYSDGTSAQLVLPRGPKGDGSEIVIDEDPQSGSTNAVSSGGVYDALVQKADKSDLEAYAAGIGESLATKADAQVVADLAGVVDSKADAEDLDAEVLARQTADAVLLDRVGALEDAPEVDLSGYATTESVTVGDEAVLTAAKAYADAVAGLQVVSPGMARPDTASPVVFLDSFYPPEDAVDGDLWLKSGGYGGAAELYIYTQPYGGEGYWAHTDGRPRGAGSLLSLDSYYERPEGWLGPVLFYDWDDPVEAGGNPATGDLWYRPVGGDNFRLDWFKDGSWHPLFGYATTEQLAGKADAAHEHEQYLTAADLPEPYDDAAIVGRVQALESATPVLALVAHGDDPTVARPDAQKVEWRGAAQPANAASWDTWLGGDA